MKRLATLSAGLGLLTAACGAGAASSLGLAPTGPVPSSSSSATGATPTGPRTSTSSPAHPATSPGHPSASPAGVVGLQVWLIRSGKLFVTQRTAPYGPAVGTAPLDAMLSGPTAAQHAAR